MSLLYILQYPNIFPRVSFQLSPKDLAEEMVLELHQHLLAEVPGRDWVTPKSPLKMVGWVLVCGNCSYLQNAQKKLGCGFKHKHFLFSPLLGEMIHFDEHMFQMGWNHQLENFSDFLKDMFSVHKNCPDELWWGRWHCLGDISYLKGGEATSSQNWNDGWWLHIPEKRSNILKKGGH